MDTYQHRFGTSLLLQLHGVSKFLIIKPHQQYDKHRLRKCCVFIYNWPIISGENVAQRDHLTSQVNMASLNVLLCEVDLTLGLQLPQSQSILFMLFLV